VRGDPVRPPRGHARGGGHPAATDPRTGSPPAAYGAGIVVSLERALAPAAGSLHFHLSVNSRAGTGGQRGNGPQPAAFFTSARILASSVAVNRVSAKATGHIAPSSSVAASLNPRVEYRALNFFEFWKKQTTLPSRSA
jgi:hypothetical protein